VTAAVSEDLTTTVEGVELLRVGTWDASTGKARVTRADLAAMVDAWGNPAHDAAPVKIGHDDDRFQDSEGNPPSTRDGEPAYGWVENLRLSEDGAVLIGDLVGVPRMLADVMSTALRRRSVELVRHDRVGDKTYSAVLTGIALLGVQAPAVKGLADLRALFAEQLAQKPERFSVEIVDDTPDLPQSASGNPERVAETLGSTNTPTAGVGEVRLSKELRTALGVPDGASDEEIRSILKKRGLALAEGEQIENDVAVTPPATNPPAPPATTPPGAGQPGGPAGPGTTPPAATPAATPPATTPTQTPPATPAAEQHSAAAFSGTPTSEAVMLAAQNLGLTVVDREMFTALQADAAAGRAARDEQNRITWDGIIRQAVEVGKLHPTAFKTWRANIETNPETVIELLAAMPENRRTALPTSPVGHADQYSAGPDGKSAEELAAAERRKTVWEHFGIEAPAAAATPKG
jgi:hypothetical protein